MATTTTNFGWDIPQSTDLVKDGATAIAALGQDIDTALVDLKGGTTGQVLAKASGTDLDFSWVAQDDSNAIQNAIVDAKGDIIAATAADTPARLAVGTNGHVLTADSTQATGLKWAAVAAGGKVLQVVNATSTTQTNVASTTYTDTTLSATITPSSTTSKILVIYSQVLNCERSAIGTAAKLQLLRGSTSIQNLGFIQNMNATGASFTALTAMVTSSCLDSPSTTSATTYKTQIAANTTANGGIAIAQIDSNPSSMTLLEIGA
jgi:hypothetical protein